MSNLIYPKGVGLDDLDRLYDEYINIWKTLKDPPQLFRSNAYVNVEFNVFKFLHF